MNNLTEKESESDASDADLEALVHEARAGNCEVLPQLRRALDERPEIWRHAADLGRHAATAWIGLICGPDEFLRESLKRGLEEFVAAHLGKGEPTAMERLLVERIAVNWLMVNYADMLYTTGKDMPLKQVQAMMNRQDRAQHRLLASIAALTSLRRLLPRAETGQVGAKNEPPDTMICRLADIDPGNQHDESEGGRKDDDREAQLEKSSPLRPRKNLRAMA